MPGSLFRVALLILGLIFGRVGAVSAQLNIPLDSVEKFTLISSGPWWHGPAYFKYEIVPENDKWKIYQLEVHARNMDRSAVNSTTRRYSSDIGKSDIVNFLRLIAKQDTGIHPALFNIDKGRVLSGLDTMLPYLYPRERSLVVKKISSKKFLDSATVAAVRHSNYDDRTGYYINIKTKGGKIHELKAYANFEVYGHLPWMIGDLASYDPRISVFFDSVVKNDANIYSADRFYKELAFWAFIGGVKTTLAADQLKQLFPLAYRSLASSFNIAQMGDNNRIYEKWRWPKDSLIYWAHLKIKGAADPLILNISFRPVDTMNIYSKKLYADTLKKLMSKITIFDRLKKQPNAKLTVTESFMKYNGAQVWGSMSKYFPDIKRYDPKQSHLLYLTGDNDIRSVWILLPDNTLILCKYLYKGQFQPPKKEDTHFMGLDDTMIQKHYGKSAKVIIHLDPAGKLIKDYGEAPELDLVNNF